MNFIKTHMGLTFLLPALKNKNERRKDG